MKSKFLLEIEGGFKISNGTFDVNSEGKGIVNIEVPEINSEGNYTVLVAGYRIPLRVIEIQDDSEEK